MSLGLAVIAGAVSALCASADRSQNFYVPPIILNAVQTESPNGEPTEAFTCIDGKQRCTSIQSFMDGLIPFVSPKTKEKFWYHKYGDKTRGKPLPDALRRRFDMVQIQVVEYRDLTEEQMRDIFRESIQFLMVACALTACGSTIPPPLSLSCIY